MSDIRKRAAKKGTTYQVRWRWPDEFCVSRRGSKTFKRRADAVWMRPSVSKAVSDVTVTPRCPGHQTLCSVRRTGGEVSRPVEVRKDGTLVIFDGLFQVSEAAITKCPNMKAGCEPTGDAVISGGV